MYFGSLHDHLASIIFHKNFISIIIITRQFYHNTQSYFFQHHHVFIIITSLSSSYIYKGNWKYCATFQIISKAFPRLDGQAGQRALISSIDHSCQFNFRQIQKSNISAFQSPGDNFDFLPTFDFSMPGDLLLPKLHTFNSNFNSNYCLYKSVESFLVEESAYIGSIAVTLFLIKQDAFSAVGMLTQGGLTFLLTLETFKRHNCV